jgi:hypothetical protein
MDRQKNDQEHGAFRVFTAIAVLSKKFSLIRYPLAGIVFVVELIRNKSELRKLLIQGRDIRRDRRTARAELPDTQLHPFSGRTAHTLGGRNSG